MAGQRPCVPEFNVMKDADVTHTTKFGVFAERFLSTHGAEKGNEIRPREKRFLKLEWRDCCEFMAAPGQHKLIMHRFPDFHIKSQGPPKIENKSKKLVF